MKKNVWIAFAVVSMSCCAGVDAIGFRESGGVHVAEGTQTLSGALMVSPQGEFVKTGAGTVEIPMSGIDNNAPYNITVAGGKLSLTGAQGASSATPPAFVAEKAEFWVDASTLAEGDAVSTWNDCREGGVWSAVVQYRNATDETPPVVVVTNGTKGVYFGGKSGKWMRFQKSGQNANLAEVHHLFVVMGVYSWWSPPLGYVTTSRGEGMLATTASGGNTVAFGRSGSQPLMFTGRGDLDWRHFAARFFIDGRLVDPYVCSPRHGFQLLEGDMLTAPTTYQSFFYNYFETFKNDTPGGDYLCEAILFTQRLTEAERLAVERYLMAKWSLPKVEVKGPDRTTWISQSEPRGTGTVRTAPGATAEVAVDAGGESVPLAFAGSGDVVKKGEGTLVVGAADVAPGAGRFTLEAGDIVLRGGLAPSVAVGPGETWQAAERNTGPRPDNFSDTTDAKIAYDVNAGIRIARTAAAGTSSAVKTGDGELRVAEVSDGVKRLSVSAGTLTLAARETPPCDVVALADDAEVYIPNHSFELPFKIVDNNRNYRLGGTANGWHNPAADAGMQFVTLYPRVSTWTTYAFPDGTNALMIVFAGRAETDVTVPRAGEYELSFWATSRYGNPVGSSLSADGIKRPVVNILFAGRVVGRVQVNKGEFFRFRHRFTVTADEAGTSQRLGFKSLRAHTDGCLIIDDVHFRAVTAPGRTDVVKVPGGDFEMNDLAGATSSTPGLPAVFSREMRPDGWTLGLTAAALTQNPTNGYVAVVNPASLTYHSSTYRTPFFPFADPGSGSAALGFLGACGTAQSPSFTLPAGRWTLRGWLAEMPMCARIMDSGEKNFTSVAAVRAVLTRGDGTETDLGEALTPRLASGFSASHLPETCLWTNVVEVAADETVTLRLSQTEDAGVALDDLEFVPAAAAAPQNLVMNPGFERNGATWGHYIPAGGVEYSASYPNAAFTYATDSWAFGYAIHEGMHCARLHNRSGVRTYVTLPDAGLYRLTLHIRARADEVSGLNPVRAYIVSPSGATNAICRIKTPFGQNFTAYSHLFRADEAGRHWLHIEGEGVPSGILDKNGRDSANKTTLLDGVSVVKVDEAAQTVPSMPGKLRIDVAEGARLALDYPGTVKVGGVRLGGARAAGIVDAATHPDYVSGIGALEVVPGGTMLMFK